MKLKNKKTGEIAIIAIDINHSRFTVVGKNSYFYNSLAELNEEWEDYEEPKEYWSIEWDGTICHTTETIKEEIRLAKSIGNYFETEEEAEKAVERLRAWKRLKDNSWVPVHYNIATREVSVIFSTGYTITEQDRKDINLLFGGKE